MFKLRAMKTIKKIVGVLLLALAPVLGFSQGEIHGKVIDSENSNKRKWSSCRKELKSFNCVLCNSLQFPIAQRYFSRKS